LRKAGEPSIVNFQQKIMRGFRELYKLSHLTIYHEKPKNPMFIKFVTKKLTEAMSQRVGLRGDGRATSGFFKLQKIRTRGEMWQGRVFLVIKLQNIR
jgi:hypothetical protein